MPHSLRSLFWGINCPEYQKTEKKLRSLYCRHVLFSTFYSTELKLMQPLLNVVFWSWWSLYVMNSSTLEGGTWDTVQSELWSEQLYWNKWQESLIDSGEVYRDTIWEIWQVIERLCCIIGFKAYCAKYEEVGSFMFVYLVYLHILLPCCYCWKSLNHICLVTKIYWRTPSLLDYTRLNATNTSRYALSDCQCVWDYCHA